MCAFPFVLLLLFPLGCDDGPTDATRVPGADAAAADAGIDAGLDGSTDASVDAAVDAVPTDASAGRDLDALEQLFETSFVPATSEASFAGTVDAAYHCIAAAGAVRRARAGARWGEGYLEALERGLGFAADRVTHDAATWHDLGWGLDMPWDAFGDGSVNPASTVYGFQTSFAIWCLAEAADVTGNPTYRALAESTFERYRSRAFVMSSEAHRLDSASCGYFFYSDQPTDVGRLVKNVNASMSVAALVLDHYGASPEARAAGLAGALSQSSEVSYASYGYLGIYDTEYTSAHGMSFDDHNSIEVYSLWHAGKLLSNETMRTRALAHYRAYRDHGSPSYVGYAACNLAREDDEARDRCATWVEAHGANSSAGIGLVTEYE